MIRLLPAILAAASSRVSRSCYLQHVRCWAAGPGASSMRSRLSSRRQATASSSRRSRIVRRNGEQVPCGWPAAAPTSGWLGTTQGTTWRGRHATAAATGPTWRGEQRRLRGRRGRAPPSAADGKAKVCCCSSCGRRNKADVSYYLILLSS